MATVPEMNPKPDSTWSGEDSKRKQEAHQDRFALLVIILLFAVMIALAVLAALSGPLPQGDHFSLPIMP